MTQEEAEERAAQFGKDIAEAEDAGDEEKRKRLRGEWSQWRNQFASRGKIWWATYRAFYRQYEKAR